jgi:hypothetical protein
MSRLLAFLRAARAGFAADVAFAHAQAERNARR